ncbi:MAG: hypothetical protein WCX71_03395 [Candidatus Buchananbacteria bacterium]
MNLNWKRIALIFGFLAVVVLIGYSLYFFFLKPTIPITNQPTNAINGSTGTLPQAGTNSNIKTTGNINGGLQGSEAIPGPPSQTKTETAASITATGGLTKTTALTNNRVYQSTLSGNGQNVIYYDKATGLFYQVGADGRSTPYSDQVFYSVETVYWSTDKTKAVMKFPDGATILYDFATKKQTTLPSHWKDFDFSPNSQQMVFKSMGTSADNRWLAIANADGSGAQKIELLGDTDSTVYPSWSPNGQTIAMYTEDQSFDKQNLYFIGKNSENFKSTIVEGRGLQSQWSENGDRLLYSAYTSNNGYRPALWIVEAQGESIGQNRKNLQLNTWADKCTFSNNDTVYCAVPTQLKEGAGIFYKEMDDVSCDIYKIDLVSGAKTKIAIPEGNQNIETMMTSDDGKYLYFTSQANGKLYKINLK